MNGGLQNWDKITLQIVNGEITADLSKLNVPEKARLALVLDVGGMRVRSDELGSAPDVAVTGRGWGDKLVSAEVPPKNRPPLDYVERSRKEGDPGAGSIPWALTDIGANPPDGILARHRSK